MPSKKSTYLLFVLFCVFTLIKAQNTFNLNYTSGIKSAAFGVEEVSANKYFLNSVFVDSSLGQQGLDLKLLNGIGGVIKGKRYLFPNIDFLSYFNNRFQYNLSNCTELISGGGYTGTISTVIYTSVNKNTLDTNWVKYYSDGVYDYHLNITFKTKPNEFWLFGNKFNNSGYSLRPCALKIDSLGNILSIKEFTNFINYDVRTAYFDASSNLIYFGGKNYNPSTAVECIACMDTLGNIVWNNQNIGPVNFGQIEKRNNYIVVSGSKWFSQTGNFGDYKLHLIKLNSGNGAIQWAKSYTDKNIGNLATSFVINNDESIVTAGTLKLGTINSFLTHDGVILKVNSAGDSLWMKTYGNFMSGTQEAFYDIKKTSDGGYIMCGVPFYAPDPSSQSWVVKTDSVGFAPGISTNVNSSYTSHSKINVFPNPVDNKLNIKFDDMLLSNHTIKIKLIDTFGKVILEEEKGGFETATQLNTQYIKNGTYLLQLKSEKEIATFQIIIVH